MFSNMGQAHDQVDEVLEEGQDAPETDAGNSEQEPSQDVPQYLTRADLQAALAQQAQQFKREIQSRTDRVDHRLQQRFQQLAGPYQRAAEVAVAKGIIQPGQKAAFAQALHDDAVREAFASPGTQRQGQQTPPPGDEEAEPGTQVDARALTAQGERLAVSLGLAQGDPELEHIVTDGSPEEFLASIRVAARIKAKRTQAPAANRQTPAGSGNGSGQTRKPVGRSLAGSGAGRSVADNNPIASIESESELFDLAWKQEKAQRGRG